VKQNGLSSPGAKLIMAGRKSNVVMIDPTTPQNTTKARVEISPRVLPWVRIRGSVPSTVVTEVKSRGCMRFLMASISGKRMVARV